MAGGPEEAENQNEPTPPPNSPLQEAKQEGLKQKKYPHTLLKRLSSGDINKKTAAGLEEEGEGKSPKKILAKDGKVTPPPKIRRTKSCFNPAELSDSQKDEEL